MAPVTQIVDLLNETSKFQDCSSEVPNMYLYRPNSKWPALEREDALWRMVGLAKRLKCERTGSTESRISGRSGLRS